MREFEQDKIEHLDYQLETVFKNSFSTGCVVVISIIVKHLVVRLL